MAVHGVVPGTFGKQPALRGGIIIRFMSNCFFTPVSTLFILSDTGWGREDKDLHSRGPLPQFREIVGIDNSHSFI